MVCGDRSGDAAYGKIMKFIYYPKRYAIKLKHIPFSPHISKHISKVVCGGLGWFAEREKIDTLAKYYYSFYRKDTIYA